MPSRLFARLFAAALVTGATISALPAAASIIILDAAGCTAGGALTWDASSNSVYCMGSTTSPPGILTITGPDCPSGTALGWNASQMAASCMISAGAKPKASVTFNVSLPGCGAGMVSWNASTRVLSCRRAGADVLNIDASTSTAYDPLTDGLLVMRYLFGLRGSTLTGNALAPTATRTDPAAIAAHLDSIRTALDVDNNGVVDALTDGALIMRYMFGGRGASLINGAIGNGALNGNAASIEAKLQSLMP